MLVITNLYKLKLKIPLNTQLSSLIQTARVSVSSELITTELKLKEHELCLRTVYCFLS